MPREVFLPTSTGFSQRMLQGLVKAMKKEDGCHDAGAIFQKLMHKKRHLGQWDCEENCVSVCVCVCM